MCLHYDESNYSSKSTIEWFHQKNIKVFEHLTQNLETESEEVFGST